MKLGSFDVPDDGGAALRRLLDREQQHPYRGADQTSLETRLARALPDLQRRQLDAEAALYLFANVLYWTDEDGRGAWREVYASLAKWCMRNGLDVLNDCYWLQVAHENDVNEVFEANNLAGRTDPSIQPGIRNLGELWAMVKLADNSGCSGAQLEILRTVAARPVWVLFWDVNLSGATAAKEIKRIGRCSQILRPGLDTTIHLASQINAAAARETIAKVYADLGLSGEQFSARELGSGDTLQSGTRLPSSMHQRAVELCRNFFDQVVRNDAKRDRLRDVSEFGYRDGGLLLVRQSNCPNNSIPLLWYVSPQGGAAGYAAPFARRFSTQSHQSAAPHDLDQLTLEQVTGYAARMKALCASRGTGARIVAVSTFRHPAENPAELADAILDLSTNFAGRRFQGQDWDTMLHQPLAAFLEKEARHLDHLRLVLHAHGSIAFAAGAALNLKLQKRIDVWQGGAQGSRWWTVDDNVPGQVMPPLQFEVSRTGCGEDIAVAIGLVHSIAGEVKKYVGNRIAVLLSCEPQNGPSQTAIINGAHAWQVAQQIVSEVRKLRIGSRLSGILHIFAACPNAVLVALGRQHYLLGTCQLYEYDPEPAIYTPSLKVTSSR